MWSLKFLLILIILKTTKTNACSISNDLCSTEDIPCFQFNCICLILTIIILIELIIFIILIGMMIVKFKNETTENKVNKFKHKRQLVRN
jgi:uncharacterized membrane protein